MTAKIESHVKPTQGHFVPGQLNPAKQPDGKLENDTASVPAHAPGLDSQSSSGSSVPPLALWIGGWPIHATGHSESRGSASTALSDLATSNHPGKSLGEYLERPLTPSQAGSPPAPRQEPQAGSGSRKNAGAGQDGSIFPSGADSEELDLMHAVIGDPKKWGDLDAGIQKLKDEDAHLDKNPFIAAHLNPEIKSPKHAKANWDKLPGPDHRMFPDYLITEHPEYYSSRTERRNSASQGNDSHRPSEGHDQMGRTQSFPTDASSSARPAYAGIDHPDAASPVNGGPDNAQLDDLTQENARLQKKAQAAANKAFLAGVIGVGVGAGVVGGVMIASDLADSSTNAPENS